MTSEWMGEGGRDDDEDDDEGVDVEETR